jgi:hypothetical protein
VSGTAGELVSVLYETCLAPLENFMYNVVNLLPHLVRVISLLLEDHIQDLLDAEVVILEELPQ